RDVVLRAIEPSPNRLAALLSGAIDAAVLTHPETIIARRQGFNELLFFGDHIEFVSAGVVATEKNISQKPDFVRRFIRGALKTFYWIKANEKEVAARLAKATKSSESDGLELYRTGVKLFSQDGHQRAGLRPGPWEREGLGLAIKEHGVDIATAVDTESAITQRVQGADLYIVGGWRYTPFLKWYGSKHITHISKLRGGKIGVR